MFLLVILVITFFRSRLLFVLRLFYDCFIIVQRLTLSKSRPCCQGLEVSTLEDSVLKAEVEVEVKVAAGSRAEVEVKVAAGSRVEVEVEVEVEGVQICAEK